MVESAVNGLVQGGVYAVLGVCVVVLYQMVGVLNIAQGAIGAFGCLTAAAIYDGGASIPISVLVGMGVSASIGFLAGAAMATWFSEASPAVRSTVAIGILITLISVGFRVFGDDPTRVPAIVPEASVAVADMRIQLSSFVSLLGALIIAAGVHLLLRHTLLGLRLRALAERPGTSELLGVPARKLAVIVWTVVGALSALAILVVANTRTPSILPLSMLVVPALGAGLFGRYQSVWLAVVGGLTIGLAEGTVQGIRSIGPYKDIAPFIVIVFALLWTQRNEVWDEAR